MWPGSKQYGAEIARAKQETEKWKARAQRIAGAYRQLEREYDRVVQDNRVLAEKIVDVASRPPTIIPAPQVDVAGILEGVRRMVQPDIVVRGTESAEQVVNWSEQGLDNNGGVREFTDKDIDRANGEKPQIPDYVLDIERLTEQQAGRGGWYNPGETQTNSTPT